MNSFYNRTTELISSLKNTYGLGDVFSHLILDEYLSYWSKSSYGDLNIIEAAKEEILDVAKLAGLLPELAQTTREHQEFLIHSMDWVHVYGDFRSHDPVVAYPYVLSLWVDRQAKIHALHMQKGDIGWGRWVRKDLL